MIWTKLYSNKSATDKGTLFQLKNVLNRTSVPNDPKDNMQSTEDFFELVLVSHIIVAADREYKQGMELEDLVDIIVKKHIKLTPQSAGKTCISSKQQNSANIFYVGQNNNIDFVCTYAHEILTLGMIWMNFYDAIKEGDGERILRIWKYLMVIFKETNHRNYAKESALLLISYHFSSSERTAAQLLTSRFVNTKGRPGCNLPCDLHLEHLNRRLKGVISNMESNIKPSSITRAARALGIVDEICRSFRDSLSVDDVSDIHHKPLFAKDLKMLTDILRDKRVFDVIPGRRHAFISKSNSLPLLERVNDENIQDWIIERIVPSIVF